MLLKKQTVWLLTMLSLVVVLSVYYMTSENQPANQFADITDEGNTEVENEEATVETSEDEPLISSVSSDELFDALRLELEQERSRIKEELRDIIASAEVSSTEKSDAYDRIQEMEHIAQKEAVLETLIVSMGYKDALVRADGDQVRVTVKSNEQSPQKANEIIQLVRTELGQTQAVAVEFQPVN